MEFATEMIAEASRKGLRICEVSVPLKRAEAYKHYLTFQKYSPIIKLLDTWIADRELYSDEKGAIF